MTPQKRKILLFDSGKEWGGGTNSMLELLKRIDRQRFDITCCFYHNYARAGGESIEQVLHSLGIPMVLLPARHQPGWAKLTKEVGRSLLFFSRDARKSFTRKMDNLWRIQPDARRLRQLLQDGGYDILYMNNQPGSNEEGYHAVSGLPVALVQHCRIEPVLSPSLVELVNAQIDKIIAVSRGVEKVLLNNGVKRQYCVTVNNAIDIHQPLPDRESMRKTLDISPDTFVFGSIGSLIARKSNHHTLDALAQFSQRHPNTDWKMILIGEGPERAALVSQAKALGIAEHLIFTGFRNNPFEYLATFDAFILASSSEGLPRVVLEAMLLGIPVIGSDVTGTAELIDHQRTGLLFQWSDSQTLAQHLSQISKDAELRQQLAENARQHVHDHYAIEHYVAGVEHELASISSRRTDYV
ncbi:MAG TPA: glycosyltransferase [Scandinavium sp.]|jgi:glycosyltransferase involved in cell wall biosynthesis|uniref:glycosyltransferase n=1 Tax=Scandinavium sp. TaxID=2830653 RepID=UPI002E33580E|nr:glycosyltransferase [Scandinavium sp.]HEX4501700.1 glycosyltransferase [Scandinavium sp.]